MSFVITHCLKHSDIFVQSDDCAVDDVDGLGQSPLNVHIALWGEYKLGLHSRELSHKLWWCHFIKKVKIGLQACGVNFDKG